eukprot:2592116-Pyramimonas_sp.AAC.1
MRQVIYVAPIHMPMFGKLLAVYMPRKSGSLARQPEQFGLSRNTVATPHGHSGPRMMPRVPFGPKQASLRQSHNLFAFVPVASAPKNPCRFAQRMRHNSSKMLASRVVRCVFVTCWLDVLPARAMQVWPLKEIVRPRATYSPQGKRSSHNMMS